MAWLIDSHGLLWALFDPDRLGPTTRRTLEDPASTVLVSPVSYWEISLKSGLGKLTLPGTEPEEIPGAARDLGLQESPLPSDVFASIHQLPYAPDHRDPFDRMLVWQAIRGTYGFLSRDRRLRHFAAEGLKIDW